MSKPKREKRTTTVTPEKLGQQKLFVQAEGELTQAQLEAIGESQCAERNRCRRNYGQLILN